jgi:hypothetical protein
MSDNFSLKIATSTPLYVTQIFDMGQDGFTSPSEGGLFRPEKSEGFGRV